METPALSIVIPVFNEALNLEATLESLHQNIHVPYELLIVYDFDEDSTLPLARQLMSRNPTMKLIKNTVCRGPSGAIRSGIRASRGPRILIAMADLCDDFSQVPQMIDWVPAKAEIACPSRYCQGGEQLLNPSLKVWAPKTAGRLLRFFTGIPTLDPTNSYKLYSAELLRKMRLSSRVSFSVTLEIMAKAHVLGARIVEIPTVWRNRQFGKTSFKLGRSLVAYFPWFLYAMLRNRLFWLRPSFLGAPGTAPSSETADSSGSTRV